MVIISAFLSPDLHSCIWNCLLGSCTRFNERTRLFCSAIISPIISSQRKTIPTCYVGDKTIHLWQSCFGKKNKEEIKTHSPTFIFILLVQVVTDTSAVVIFTLKAHVSVFLCFFPLLFLSKQESIWNRIQKTNYKIEQNSAEAIWWLKSGCRRKNIRKKGENSPTSNLLPLSSSLEPHDPPVPLLHSLTAPSNTCKQTQSLRIIIITVSAWLIIYRGPSLIAVGSWGRRSYIPTYGAEMWPRRVTCPSQTLG